MTRNCIRAGVALVLATLMMSGAWSSAGAQDWPTRAVKFILPIGAGAVDVRVRTVLSESGVVQDAKIIDFRVGQSLKVSALEGSAP